MENFNMDKIKEVVNKFDLSEYVDRRVVGALAMYGIYKVGYELLWVPTNGFWIHYLRPRRNLRSRFEGSDWVVVTGASDGIGEALCYEFAKSGFNIILISRTLSKLEKVAKNLRDFQGVKTIIIQYDFANLKTPADAEALTKLITEKTKGCNIGVLANNVGIITGGAYHGTQLDAMFRTFSVNIAAQSVMTHIFTNRW